MAEQALDLRSSMGFVRQRWPLVAVGAVLGLGLGATYSVLVPPQLSSTALVLVPGGASSSSQIDVATQVRIVLSTPVLEKAGRSVAPALTATQLASRIDVQAVTTQLLEIQASSSHARQAQDLAQAVATSYVGTVQDRARVVAEAGLGDLRTRESALSNQVTALQQEITATTARLRAEDAKSQAGRRDAQLLAQLTSEQADTALQLDKVKQDLSTNDAAAATTDVAGIVQPASPAAGPAAASRVAAWTTVGGLVGAAAVVLLLLLRVRRNPRLRSRDDLADAVGSNVVAAVRSRPQRSVAAWSTLFATYEAPAIDAWAFRQMLRALVVGPQQAGPVRTSGVWSTGRVEHPPSITVICLAGDARGVAVAPQLAVFAASLGITTRFVVANAQTCPPSLWAACSTGRESQLRPGLVVATDADSGMPDDPGSSVAADVAASAASQKAPWHNPANGAGPDVSAHRPDLGGTAIAIAGLGPHDPTAPKSAPRPAPADLTIVLLVADRAVPTLRGVPQSSATVLALAPGAGTREELARIAVAVDRTGRRIDGIVVADPDPADRTTGRRTLDERVRDTPLPMRMTGVSSLPMMASDRGKRR